MPPLEGIKKEEIFRDAEALGYEVFAFIWDDESEQLWCIGCRAWVDSCNCELQPNMDPEIGVSNVVDAISVLSSSEFQKAMEKVHGGPLTSEDTIDVEEMTRKAKNQAKMERTHDTWHDPQNPEAVVDPDGACFCGWMGIDPPAPEFAPPGCSCIESPQEDD